MEYLENFTAWSDARLLSEAIHCGEEARKWRSRFLGMLPEIDRRKLYEQHGYSSIFVFAFKVGGVSEEQVKCALRIDRELQDAPIIRNLFTSGEVSMSKVARVVSVATPENEETLASQIQILSNRSLETYVRDLRHDQSEAVHVQNSPLHHKEQIFQVPVNLDPEIAKQLLELEAKGIDINEFIADALTQREQEIQEEKEKIAEEVRPSSRHIPARTKRLLTKEYGTNCSISTCKKPSREVHHTQRYALTKTHNPHYLAPLCKEHHEIAHSIDLKVQRRNQKRRDRVA